ncbi:MAG: ribokinase [Planctomycetota bacterium]
MSRIIVVGSANMDMVVRAGRLPRPGETVLGGRFAATGGGKGANQAVAAARAGGRVVFLGAVGGDSFGDATRAALARDRINIDFMKRDRGAPSGVALIVVDATGRNLIAVAPGANARYAPADVARAAGAFRGTRVVIASLEVPIASVARAFALGRAAGALTVLNPAPAPDRPLPRALLAADYLIPNEGELERLSDVAVKNLSSLAVAAGRLLARGAGYVIVTRGEKGVAVFGPKENFRVPAARVKAVDTVGAGDCFSGAFAAALVEGYPLREAVCFAVAAAGLSVTRRGAQDAMPRRREILAMMR